MNEPPPLLLPSLPFSRPLLRCGGGRYTATLCQSIIFAANILVASLSSPLLAFVSLQSTSVFNRRRLSLWQHASRQACRLASLLSSTGLARYLSPLFISRSSPTCWIVCRRPVILSYSSETSTSGLSGQRSVRWRVLWADCWLWSESARLWSDTWRRRHIGRCLHTWRSAFTNCRRHWHRPLRPPSTMLVVVSTAAAACLRHVDPQVVEAFWSRHLPDRPACVYLVWRAAVGWSWWRWSREAVRRHCLSSTR